MGVLDKKGDNKDFEEKLEEQLFADENTQKIQVCVPLCLHKYYLNIVFVILHYMFIIYTIYYTHFKKKGRVCA